MNLTESELKDLLYAIELAVEQGSMTKRRKGTVPFHMKAALIWWKVREAWLEKCNENNAPNAVPVGWEFQRTCNCSGCPGCRPGLGQGPCEVELSNEITRDMCGWCVAAHGEDKGKPAPSEAAPVSLPGSQTSAPTSAPERAWESPSNRNDPGVVRMPRAELDRMLAKIAALTAEVAGLQASS
jgi:hypothetical protein